MSHDLSQFVKSLREQSNCFACGSNNPWGLKLKFDLCSDGWVEAKTLLHPNFQGFRMGAHGGISFTLLDEAAVWAALLQKHLLGPTYEIHARLKKKVPLAEEIIVRAKTTSCRHNICCAEAEIRNIKGEILATGEVSSKTEEIEKLNSF